MPDQNPVRPPDMVGAGMMPPGQPPVDLMGALSQGTMPMAALQMMVQPSQSPGMTALSALGAGVHAGRGQADPMMGQQLAQRQQQMQQAQQMMQMHERQQQAAWKRTQYEDIIYDSMIKSGDPETAMLGWERKAARAKQFGVQGITPEMISRLGRGKLSTDTLNAAVLNAAAGVSDADNVRLHPALTPQDIPFIHKLAASDDYRKKLGLRDTTDVEDHQVKKQKVDMDILKYELSLRKQDEVERRTLTSEQMAARRADLQDKRLEMMADQFNRKLDAKDAKQEKNLATFETAIDNMDMLADNLNAKNFLTKDVQGKGVLGGLLTGDMQPAQAATNRKLYPYDEDLTRWKQLQATIIGFDRTVLNDIGARAFLAFKNQFQFFDEPPSAAAIHKVTDQMRQFIAVAKSGKVPVVEHVYLKLPDGRKAEMDWTRGQPLPPGAIVIGVR